MNLKNAKAKDLMRRRVVCAREDLLVMELVRG